MNWSAILFFILAVLLGWWMFRIIRTQKADFTKENFSKTMGTLGLLALGLIAFVAICVFLLRHNVI